MRIVVSDQQHLENVFVRLVHAVKNQRFAQKNWNDNFGSYWKDKKNLWGERVDDILIELGLTEQEFLPTLTRQDKLEYKDA